MQFRFSYVLLAIAAAVLSAESAKAQGSLDGPGVSLRLARLRAHVIRDVKYDLSLDVTARDSAVGAVTVRFDYVDTGDVLLDFRGRRVLSIQSNRQAVPLTAWNRAHIRLPARTLHAGFNSVVIAFVSEIAPTGASIISAHDPDGSDYLYTLLVPSDANQLFPSFDQPDLKARVTFHLTAPLGWTTVANGSEQRADSTTTTIAHHFTETRPLSTYLLAFAAGPWTRATSTANGRTINVFVRASRAKEADLDTLLALNQRAISWMERYFARPYPFEKFDLVLAPAFPFGGMEHPGVVMYNENSFIFRERPTLPRRLGRFSTILHEVAHQWFGDLVTMKWFDDLWLKEGFATYMAAKALASLEPNSGAWKSFYQSNKPAAYGVDQTTGTNPLWQELGNLDQAKSNYGAIVYNKAPSVLKQLNFLVGEAAFQKGVRAFLGKFAYTNATWQDLLSAIGKASGKNLTVFGKNFMLRPGMPVVEQKLTLAGGKIASLELTQRPAQTLSGDAPWPMRTELLLAYDEPTPSVRLPVDITTKTTVVRAAVGKKAPRFVFANVDDYGYFLTLLDSTSVTALEQGAIATVRDPLLRTMLWGALWDLVRDARLEPARFIRLALRDLPHERDEQIFPNVLGRLTRAVTTYASDSVRNQLRPQLESMLWQQLGDRTLSYGLRRACLDAYIGLATSPDALGKLIVLYAADSVVGEPMRDPTRWEIVNRLMVLDHADASRFLAVQSARDTTADGKRRAFVAGAARRTAEAKRDYFTRYFSDATLNEEWASGSLGAFNAHEHTTLTLPYLRLALDSLPFVQANRRIFFLGSWLNAFIGGQSGSDALHVVRKFLDEHPTLPRDLRQKVQQTVDELERTVRIRRRFG